VIHDDGSGSWVETSVSNGHLGSLKRLTEVLYVTV
jgi:hypothetical protein